MGYSSFLHTNTLICIYIKQSIFKSTKLSWNVTFLFSSGNGTQQTFTTQILSSPSRSSTKHCCLHLYFNNFAYIILKANNMPLVHAWCQLVLWTMVEQFLKFSRFFLKWSLSVKIFIFQELLTLIFFPLSTFVSVVMYRKGVNQCSVMSQSSFLASPLMLMNLVFLVHLS